MTRHPAFIPLSREHHDGLLLATRLQQGTKALERFWSHDLSWQAQFVVEFFDKNLADHFRIEEQILFPEVIALAETERSMIDTLLQEHAEMRELATALRKPAGEFGKTLKLFGKILERHIRREERELFPFCETQMSEKTLNNLARSLNH